MRNQYPHTLGEDLGNLHHAHRCALDCPTLSISFEVCYLDGDVERVYKYTRNVRTSILHGSVPAATEAGPDAQPPA